MTKFFVCCLITIATAATANDDSLDIQAGPDVNPWTNLDMNNDPEHFQFAIVTDRTGGHRPGIFMDGVRKLNLLQPEFVMSVGDLIEGYTEDLEEIGRQWHEFNQFVAQLEMPFFYIPGNHDVSNRVMEKEWQDRYGRLYYHFVYKDVLFLCLDSEDPPSSQMSADQIEYVRKTLEENQDVRWTLVFIHKPLWVYNAENGWPKVEALLRGRPHTVFAGHTHDYFRHARNDTDYIVLATMGGGSPLRGPNFGEFDHFMWVTMTEEGPRFANLMLNGIWDENITSEDRLTLVRPLISGSAVRTDGIVVDAPAFEQATTKLRLTNDADLPMHVALAIRPTRQAIPSMQTLERTIPPNSVEIVDLTVAARSPLPPTEVAPLNISYTLQYDVPEQVQPVLVRGVHRIVIDSRYALRATDADVEVDGSLEEWGSLAVSVQDPGQVLTDRDAWQGFWDSSLEFDVRYDSEFVYAAIRVTDDDVRVDPRRDYYRQDSVEFRLDARPADQRSGGQPLEDFLLLALAAGNETESLYEAELLPANVQAASVVTEDGYTAEFAIPLAYLRAKFGADWQSLRINVSLNDLDADGMARVSWRPRWDTAANYAGSGTFVRQ